VILPVAVGVIAVVVALAGGDLRRLGTLPIRGTWWVVSALVVQVAITVGSVPAVVGSTLHLASYGLAGGFVVVNRHIPGIRLTAGGGALNLAAIGANGGVMPASPAALELAGIGGGGAHFVNSGAVDGARLWWLGDVFALPEPFPLANVFSVGDVVLLVGVGVLLVRVTYGDDAAVGDVASATGRRETTSAPAGPPPAPRG
jgi:hypothetical protein